MEGGLLMKTYFLAGRATRITQDTALAIARGPARVAAWTRQRIVSSARLLNPFNRSKKADGRRSWKSSAAVRTAPATRPTRAPSDTIPEAPAARAPKTARKYPNALRRLGAEVRAADPASEVAIIKVVANLETMLHELAGTEPSVAKALKTALGGLLEVARGEVADTGRAMSEIARALETAGRRLAAGEDTEAHDARPPGVGSDAAPRR